MNWRFRSSDHLAQAEDRAAFRPNRRFLRRSSARSKRRAPSGRLSTLFGSRFWRGAELAAVLLLVVMVGQTVRWEVLRPLRRHYFQITDLIVEGNKQVPTSAIINSLGLAPRTGILEVSLKELAAQIMRNPWIKAANVSRRLPATLFIRVSERTPRTVVLADRAYLVSDDGLILKEAGPDEMSGLPLLRVRVEHPLGRGDRLLDVSRLERGARLWQQFHQHALGPRLQTAEIRLEADGSCTLLLGHGMPYLRFREDALRWQLDRLARVLRIRGIGLQELEYADLRFADKVIVKPLPRERGA